MLQVNMGPAILEVDQQHLDQVLAALQHALSSLSPLLPGAGRYARCHVCDNGPLHHAGVP